MKYFIAVGEKFGPFDIIGQDPQTKQFICKCFCGNIVQKTRKQLDPRLQHCGDKRKHDVTFLRNIQRIKDDIANEKYYGDLKIVQYLGYQHRTGKKKLEHIVRCQCVCGNVVDRCYRSLLDHKTFTCGDITEKHKVKGRKSMRKLVDEIYFMRWKSMNDRCYKSNRHNYHLYGGRGITVCDEWRYYPGDREKQELNRQNYQNYENWLNNELEKENLSYDQFIKLNYSVDRIDNNGPYSKENCRILNQQDQCNHQKTNRNVYYWDKEIRPMDIYRSSFYSWKRVYGDLKNVEYNTQKLIEKNSNYLVFIEKFIKNFFSLAGWVRENYRFVTDEQERYNFNYLEHRKYRYTLSTKDDKEIVISSSGTRYYMPKKVRYR